MRNDEQNELGLDEIQECILNFNNDEDVQRLKRFYYNKSFFEILSVGRRELTHSSFLAWLLDKNENHKLGTYPLSRLLEIIVRRNLTQSNIEIDPELKMKILSGNLSFNKVRVDTENSEFSKNGRIDILIDAEVNLFNDLTKSVKIIIENKVYSKENNKQTQRYFDVFEKERIKNDRLIIFYIYLTPVFSIKDESRCCCKQFIHINYQDILDYILEPILKMSDLDIRTKFLISEYIQELSQPSLCNINSKNGLKNYSIMAIGENERTLLTSFWKNNEKLILAAMNAIGTDPNQDTDISEQVNKAYNSLSASSRDYSKFSINGQGEYNKRKLVYEVISLYTKQHPDITLSDLKTIFPDRIQGSNGVVRSLDEVKDMTRYEKLHINDGKTEIAVCNQWGEKIYNFIEAVSINNIGITIKKR